MINTNGTICQYPLGAILSNCVNTATGWYEPKEHFLTADLHISQTIKDALQRLNVGVTAIGKTTSSSVTRLVQDGPKHYKS